MHAAKFLSQDAATLLPAFDAGTPAIWQCLMLARASRHYFPNNDRITITSPLELIYGA